MDYCYLAKTCQVMSQGGSSIYKKTAHGGSNTGGGSPKTVTLTGSMRVTVLSPQTFIGDATAKNAVGKALSAILAAETPSCVRVTAELAGSRRLDSRRLSGNVKVDYSITIPSNADVPITVLLFRWSTKSGSQVTASVQEKLTADKVSYTVTVDSGATLSGPTTTTTSMTGATSSVTVITTGAATKTTSTVRGSSSVTVTTTRVATTTTSTVSGTSSIMVTTMSAATHAVFVPILQGQMDLTVLMSNPTLFMSDPDVLTGARKGIAEMAGVDETHVKVRLCLLGGVCVGHVRRLGASVNAKRLVSVMVNYSISVPNSAGTSASAMHAKIRTTKEFQVQSIMSSNLATAGTVISVIVSAHSVKLITTTTTTTRDLLTVNTRSAAVTSGSFPHVSGSCSWDVTWLLLLLPSVGVWKFQGGV